MKTLIIGSSGQLGQALAETVPDEVLLTGLDLPDLDITSANGVRSACREIRPDVIINAAAYTAVDKAESEPDLAMAVNAEGPLNVSIAANEFDARLIHISTDFVFDGVASTPYGPDAATNPLSVYGRTKRAGEVVVQETMPLSATIVRTAWLYSKTGGNFVKTILRLIGERDDLSVVADQRGTPTWADSLAQVVWALALSAESRGVYHWTDGGECSWYDFAVAIQEEGLSLGLVQRAIPIHPISTDKYPTAAARPPYSVLDCSRTVETLDMQPVQWRTNLRRMLQGVKT